MLNPYRSPADGTAARPLSADQFLPPLYLPSYLPKKPICFGIRYVMNFEMPPIMDLPAAQELIRYMKNPVMTGNRQAPPAIPYCLSCRKKRLPIPFLLYPAGSAA